MSRADRLERLDARRVELEAEYEAVLLDALRRAAAGSWGLFGHTKDRAAGAKWEPVVTDLCDRGEEIDQLRTSLGLEPFALHEEFEASRGPVAPTAPGEPKQAKAWLERLGKDA
ncbi:hypothetical protein ASE06_16825 [Sphingopyxis sp. Root214]|jgi:hypothetical protein|uniref:hypothetical protein n=1 Tax=unclassified Sphingopyxis TaxID=2614943 RepID=UPI0006F38598|nr:MULTISPECIES: hypothetical protein [unclassified Sphingopyxis]KQZ73967.1 hypothetical protein ASD73_14480 [Sphingopyxis sp. Root154]KRC08107.1 hypothetical protein ASE06_16825 [Sphingopyxis sp. Root214]